MKIIKFISICVLCLCMFGCGTSPDEIRAAERGKTFSLAVGQASLHQNANSQHECVYIIYLGISAAATKDEDTAYAIRIKRFNMGPGTSEPYVLNITKDTKELWLTHFIKLNVKEISSNKLVYTTYRPHNK